MTDDQQLRWEAENGPRFAAAAFASVAFSIASVISQAVAFRGATEDREVLRAIDEHHTEILIGRVAEALSAATLVVALYYLYRVITARRPEGLRNLWPIAPLAPILLAVAGISGYLDVVDGAREFVSSGAQTEARAENISDDMRSTFTLAFGQAGGLALGITYVLTGVNGMRAGLFSRFIGILGILSGILIVLPIVPGGFVQLFWVAALGLLFTGRWPNGRGPAWSVVEPIPWPTAADVQAARLAVAEKAESPEPDVEEDASQAEEPHRRPASRKKKRRRGH